MEQITVSGQNAIYERHNYKNSVDFSQHLNVIKETLASFNNNVLITIIGSSGSGKSGLAKVIDCNIENTILIDSGKLCDYKHQSLDISSLMTNKDTTYIIDEGAYISKESLTSISNHIKNGSTVIMLLMDERDLTLTTLDCDIAGFTLNTNYLSIKHYLIKEH